MLFVSHLPWTHLKNQHILIAPLVVEKCPKCGTNSKGRQTCCAPDGAWNEKCGDNGENKEYTWVDGLEACHSDVIGFDSDSQSMLRRNSNGSTSDPAFGMTVDVNVEGNANANGFNEVYCMYSPITILITFLVT